MLPVQASQECPSIALALLCSKNVIILVFRLLDPSLLYLMGFFEQSDLHGHCSLQWLSIALVCPSTGMRTFNTLLLANLSLHCLICFHSLNFGSNITNIGPELHSMPINHSDIFSNVSPCKCSCRLLLFFCESMCNM